jgi:hypothetical protein
MDETLAQNFAMALSLTFKNLNMAHGSIAGANTNTHSTAPPSLLAHNKGVRVIYLFQFSKSAPLMIPVTLCIRFALQSFIQKRIKKLITEAKNINRSSQF